VTVCPAYLSSGCVDPLHRWVLDPVVCRQGFT